MTLDQRLRTERKYDLSKVLWDALLDCDNRNETVDDEIANTIQELHILLRDDWLLMACLKDNADEYENDTDDNIDSIQKNAEHNDEIKILSGMVTAYRDAIRILKDKK